MPSYFACCRYSGTRSSSHARAAVDSGHAIEAPKAAVILGILLEQGDADGIWATDQVAIDSGHADQAPTAGVNLEVFLKDHGDADGAKGARNAQSLGGQGPVTNDEQ